MPRKAEPHPYKPVSTRYTDPNGRRCSKATPGATKTTERSRVYVADVPKADGSGIDRKVSLGVRDLGAAWVRLRELLDERKRAAEGIADPLLAHARKPLSDHVEEWGRSVAVSGCKPQHAKLVLARVRTLVEVAKWKRLADLTEDSLLRALEELGRTRTKAMRKGYEGRGQQTRGHYIAATKQFAHWLVATQRTLRNPFARVRRPKAIREPRQARRVPSDEEVGRLLAYLEGELEAKPGTICRVPPRGRRLMYLLAAATGFRAGELRSLTWRMFDLDKGAVTCRTAYSKDQKQATFPLPVWLADEFREWHAQGGALWSHLKIRQPGRGMRRDLRAAGIPYEVELPEGKAFWDFHSWRHWFVSWMARQPGISPKVLMALSRHSDPRLTMSVYAKVRDEDVGEQLRRVEVPGRTHGRTESGDGGVHRDTAEQWWQERSGWPEG